MIRKALNETGVDAEVVPYQMTTDLPDLLQPLVSKPKVALNFGEDLFSLTGTAFADYIRAGSSRIAKIIARHSVRFRRTHYLCFAKCKVRRRDCGTSRDSKSHIRDLKQVFLRGRVLVPQRLS